MNALLNSWVRRLRYYVRMQKFFSFQRKTATLKVSLSVRLAEKAFEPAFCEKVHSLRNSELAYRDKKIPKLSYENNVYYSILKWIKFIIRSAQRLSLSAKPLLNIFKSE